MNSSFLLSGVAAAIAVALPSAIAPASSALYPVPQPPATDASELAASTSRSHLRMAIASPSMYIAQSPRQLSPDQLAALEQEILVQTNLARTSPTAYLSHLQAYRSRFQPDGYRVLLPENVYLRTREGIAAVDEAIAYLQEARPVSELQYSPGLSQAARDHVRDLGPRGGLGHGGSDRSNPSQRMSRYGQLLDFSAENITFGSDTAVRVVMDLIIDDGVLSRGHRQILFSSNYKRMGVACGPHRTYRVMCTMTYAGEYRE